MLWDRKLSVALEPGLEEPANTMRVLPALLRHCSSYNNVQTTKAGSLNIIISNTADRLVNGGFWKKIEPPVTKTPLEAFVDSLQQFHNRCQENTREFAKTSLEPIRVGCVEAYNKAVSQIQNHIEELNNFAERKALEYALSRQAAMQTACEPAVEKNTGEDGTVKLTLTENRPLRKGVISVVRTMANIILPPRDTYAKTNYTCCTIYE